MKDCIFCKIIRGEIPSTKVYEDDEILAFNDVNPAAPIHILVIPKKHINSLADMNPEDEKLVGKIYGVINKIANKSELDLSNLPENTILIGADISTSDTAKLNLNSIAGIIIENGSENSHVSIMARTHEIPAIVGAKNILKEIKDDMYIALNGETGEIYINPSNEQIKNLTNIKKELEIEKEELVKYKDKETITKDGYKTEVFANIGTPKDMDKVLENGAEGIGLFRSEFLYMDSDSMPTEEEQFNAYKEVLEKAGDRQVIIRTLDIGGDKDLKYLNLEKEDNPFLGYRAIRICLREPEIFKIQLRALLRASAYGKLSIMLPMISSITEIRDAKKIIEEVKQELKEKKVKPHYMTYFYFVHQEEVGHGASALAKNISEFVTCDMGCVGLDLAGNEEACSIAAKDSGGPYSYELTNKLIKLAKENNINYVVDIFPFYGSDVGAAWRAGIDCQGALIGPGVAASHGMERTHLKAIDETMKLLYLYLTA